MCTGSHGLTFMTALMPCHMEFTGRDHPCRCAILHLPSPDAPTDDLHCSQAALVAGVSALSVTLAPAAMAAQEAMMVAEVILLHLHLAPYCALQ
jgi:hypothetical protein